MSGSAESAIRPLVLNVEKCVPLTGMERRWGIRQGAQVSICGSFSGRVFEASDINFRVCPEVSGQVLVLSSLLCLLMMTPGAEAGSLQTAELLQASGWGLGSQARSDACRRLRRHGARRGSRHGRRAVSLTHTGHAPPPPAKFGSSSESRRCPQLGRGALDSISRVT